MSATRESFWGHGTYAVVGHSAERAFPRLTYEGLKESGKAVYAVDPSRDEIEGDRSYPDLDSLPGSVDAVVLEVPRDETAEWVERAVQAGIGRVWIHQGTESDEAIALAGRQGLETHHGTCAVMYLSRGFNAHGLHRLLWKAIGRY